MHHSELRTQMALFRVMKVNCRHWRHCQKRVPPSMSKVTGAIRQHYCTFFAESEASAAVVHCDGHFREVRHLANTAEAEGVHMRVPDGYADDSAAVAQQHVASHWILRGWIHDQDNRLETPTQPCFSADGGQVARYLRRHHCGVEPVAISNRARNSG